MNNSLLSQMAHVGWNLSRYVLASVTVMFIAVSVITEQFPPPFFEVYKSIKEVKDSLNVSQAAAGLAMARMEREKLMNAIDSEQKTVAGNVDDLSNPTQTPTVGAEERIKSLEYEVALLKSKLYRAEWEAEHFKEQASALKK